MYTVTWNRYPHGVEGESMDCKWKEFDSLDKAQAFLIKRSHIIKGIYWAGGYIEDSNGDMVYNITADYEELFYDDVKSQV